MYQAGRYGEGSGISLPAVCPAVAVLSPASPRLDQLFWVDQRRMASRRCASSNMLLSAFTFISRSPSEPVRISPLPSRRHPQYAGLTKAVTVTDTTNDAWSDALLFFSCPRCRGAAWLDPLFSNFVPFLSTDDRQAPHVKRRICATPTSRS